MTLIYVSNFQFDHNEYKQKRKVLTEIAWAPLPWEWDRIAAELCPAAAPHFRFAFFASFELTTSPQNAKKKTRLNWKTNLPIIKFSFNRYQCHMHLTPRLHSLNLASLHMWCILEHFTTNGFINSCVVRKIDSFNLEMIAFYTFE